MTSTSGPARRGPILAIILASFTLIVLDNSIVFTGLPHIQDELGFTGATLSWVSSVYALTFGGFLLLAARAGDIWGRRRVFMLGLSVFALTSIAVGFAPTSGTLVAARAAQGIGAAIIAPSSLALLQDTFPAGAERSRAIGYYAAAGGVSASVGLVVGGLFAEYMSWRVGFLVNGPIGLALLLATRATVPASSGASGRLDVAGAILSTLGMGSLLLGITRVGELGWGDGWARGCVLTGLVILAVFVMIERRVASPLMPPRLFADPTRAGSYLARALFMGANMGFYFFVSLFLQDVTGFGAATTGLAFVPSTAVNFAAAMLVGRLIRRFGAAPVLLGTLATGTLGMVFLARLDPASGYWSALAIPMILVGIGQGGSLVPFTMMGISGVSGSDAGAASGVVNASHQLGASLGIGLLTALAVGSGAELTSAATVSAYVRLAMTGAAALMLAAIVVTIVAMWLRAPKAALS